PERLRRERAAVRARPRLPVPHGAARPPRRLRTRGPGDREAFPRSRGRVPAQGAHADAELAARPERPHAPRRRGALPRADRLAPAAALRERVTAHRRADDERARSEEQRLNSSHEWISYAVFC